MPALAHASVAAPLCLWADALTKIVAASGDASHPLLARHDARAWLH
jgi:thiamine biosynthesis lipoprotein